MLLLMSLALTCLETVQVKKEKKNITQKEKATSCFLNYDSSVRSCRTAGTHLKLVGGHICLSSIFHLTDIKLTYFHGGADGRDC